MSIHIVREKVALKQLKEWAAETYRDMIKVVVDLERRIMAVGGEMHTGMADELKKDGSLGQDLWGLIINFDKSREERVELVSSINAEHMGNRSVHIRDKDVLVKVGELLLERVYWEE